MDLDRARTDWLEQGFAILPGYLPHEVLTPALAELGLMFPTAAGFHEGTDPRRERFLGDEFAGIDTFPFASTEVSLLPVHALLTDLARLLLDCDDIRLYGAEAWAKFTGAADYDQELHRDYLNHTVLVPSSAPEFRQVEMFVFLDEVPEELGPPHLVPTKDTADTPATPNWFSAKDSPDAQRDRFLAARPDWYGREVSTAGPAGTVVAFEQGTFHRGTGMTRPGGARYSMHLGYRRADAEWGQRQGWASRSHEAAWYRFVARATPSQLELVGFPPAGHPYWTAETRAGMALRYPGLDVSRWT